jgi:hypothetical protein
MPSQEVPTMTINVPPFVPSFFSRVLSNDSARKGIAAAVAGVLVAVVTEAVWPAS